MWESANLGRVVNACRNSRVVPLKWGEGMYSGSNVSGRDVMGRDIVIIQ